MFLGHIVQPPRARPARPAHPAARLPRPATSARRCSARPTSAGRGQEASQAAGVRHRRPRSSAACAPCSGSRPGTPTSRASGTPAARRRACSAPRTAATRGRRSTAGTTTRCGRRGPSGPSEGTPDGSMLHSVIVDPRDPAHLYIGLSGGGVFESTDGGNDWQPAQRRASVADLLPRPRAGVRARPALRAPAPAAARPALPAEPLRHLPHGPARGPVGAHRRQHAARRRRHRLPDRAAPARPRHRVGVPDGRHRRVAAHEPRRPARRRTSPATPARSWTRLDDGLPERAWLTVKRQAMTVDAGRSGRRLLRHDERRGLGAAPTKARRGRAIARTCPRSTRVELADRSSGEGPHPDAAALVHRTAEGRGRRRRRPSPSVLADLDRRYPGIRFRMVDEQDRIRKHMKVFVNDESVRDLRRRRRPRRRGHDHAGPIRGVGVATFRRQSGTMSVRLDRFTPPSAGFEPPAAVHWGSRSTARTDSGGEWRSGSRSQRRVGASGDVVLDRRACAEQQRGSGAGRRSPS